MKTITDSSLAQVGQPDAATVPLWVGGILYELPPSTAMALSEALHRGAIDAVLRK